MNKHENKIFFPFRSLVGQTFRRYFYHQNPHLILLEAPNRQQLSDLFVFRIGIVCGFEEEDSLEILRILSFFFLIKKRLCGTFLCVFDL